MLAANSMGRLGMGGWIDGMDSSFLITDGSAVAAAFHSTIS